MMKRRDFLKMILLSGFFNLLTKKAHSEKKPEEKLKKAMFWKRLY